MMGHRIRRVGGGDGGKQLVRFVVIGNRDRFRGLFLRGFLVLVLVLRLLRWLCGLC